MNTAPATQRAQGRVSHFKRRISKLLRPHDDSDRSFGNTRFSESIFERPLRPERSARRLRLRPRPLSVRFVYGVAGAFDFARVALGPCVVPALKIGVDDLVVPGDDSPARLRLPRSCRQRRVENAGRGQDLRARLEFRLLARQIGREQLGKVRRVEIGVFIRCYLDRAFGLGQNARSSSCQAHLRLLRHRGRARRRTPDPRRWDGRRLP